MKKSKVDEFDIMQKVYDLMNPLEHHMKKRVLEWVASKCHEDECENHQAQIEQTIRKATQAGARVIVPGMMSEGDEQ